MSITISTKKSCLVLSFFVFGKFTKQNKPRKGWIPKKEEEYLRVEPKLLDRGLFDRNKKEKDELVMFFFLKDCQRKKGKHRSLTGKMGSLDIRSPGMYDIQVAMEVKQAANSMYSTKRMNCVKNLFFVFQSLLQFNGFGHILRIFRSFMRTLRTMYKTKITVDKTDNPDVIICVFWINFDRNPKKKRRKMRNRQIFVHFVRKIIQELTCSIWAIVFSQSCWIGLAKICTIILSIKIDIFLDFSGLKYSDNQSRFLIASANVYKESGMIIIFFELTLFFPNPILVKRFAG